MLIVWHCDAAFNSFSSINVMPAKAGIQKQRSHKLDSHLNHVGMTRMFVIAMLRSSRSNLGDCFVTIALQLPIATQSSRS